MTHQIPVMSRKVKIQCVDQTTFEGQVFLSPSKFSRCQTVEEILNENIQFLPVELVNGQIELVNLLNVSTVSVVDTAEFNNLPEYGTHYPVTVKMVNGQFIKAQVFSDLPDRHSRAKDFFNQERRFLTVAQETQVIYVSKNNILSIRD